MRIAFLILTLWATLVIPAWSQEVTMATVLARQRIEPGRELLSPDVPVEGKLEFRARLDPNAADWEDPALNITLSVELSFDGGKAWPSITRATIVGGARGKDGAYPSVAAGMVDPQSGQWVPFPPGTLARVRYVHNLSKRVGIAGEIR